VLYPQLSESPEEDVIYLAQHFVRLGQDPRACALVRRYGVGYMVVAPDNFLTNLASPGVRAELTFYSGVAHPSANSGFQLIASAAGGRLSLYKVTICQPQKASAGPVDAARTGSG